ncbi:MAG: T9SS type A sorting domain-containing protein, partial [Bacteroidaceae bacterium]|nr:T9SS type A sorting domain-containing protein [Bacteroidaceae bacterium]
GYLNYGAAIYGTLYSQPKIFANNYAGFFDGPVAITTGLYVKGGTYTNFSYTTLNESSPLSLGLDESLQSSSIVEKLSSLQLGYYLEDKFAEGNASNTFQTNGNKTADNERLHYGLPAEQLKEEFPSLVISEKNGDTYINYVEIVPILVQAINELSSKVATLEAELGIQDPTKPVMKAKEQTTAVEETGMDVVTMSQNKPNPFSDSSVITLNIPETAKSATIGIYDMSGKLAQNIVVSERGTTNITVYAANLTPGMYIYNLIVDGKVKATRKMIVQNS